MATDVQELHDQRKTQDDLLAEFRKQADEIRGMKLGDLRDEVVRLLESAELAVYRASHCAVGPMADALQSVGRNKTILQIKASTGAGSQETLEIVDAFARGTLPHLIRRSLSEVCSCKEP